VVKALSLRTGYIWIQQLIYRDVTESEGIRGHCKGSFKLKFLQRNHGFL
jgi:hypothetical protein